VAIDDYSLNELGKWPWPRQHHAALICQLSAAKPLAIGIDVLFTEADNSVVADASVPADQALAMAMKEAGNVVVPITSQSAGQGLSAAKPAAQIAAAARQAGHIHIELDEDGGHAVYFCGKEPVRNGGLTSRLP
jgi:CHASE2 domain-containing sensor protein